jgi:hypothetical protein
MKVLRFIFFHIAFVVGLPFLLLGCLVEGTITWQLREYLSLFKEVAKNHYWRDIR